MIVPQQFGFQKNKSTELALLGIKEKLVENIENKHFTVGIFLDIKKAFDSVTHSILLNKLPCYGLRGQVYHLIKSYLENRKQYVTLNSCSSDQDIITTGVPQGSILGPFLFLLYVNDICNIPHTDDTNVFFHSKNLEETELKDNIWLRELSLWLDANELQLNISKTKYVIFRARNSHIHNSFKLCFEDAVLEKTSSIKFLGVFFSRIFIVE